MGTEVDTIIEDALSDHHIEASVRREYQQELCAYKYTIKTHTIGNTYTGELVITDEEIIRCSEEELSANINIRINELYRTILEKEVYND